MRFESPAYLILLLLIPLLWIFKNKFPRRVQESFLFSSLDFLKTDVRDIKVLWSRSSFYARLLAYSLMILALARPQQGSSEGNISTEGVDIMIAIDASGSMRAEDLGPKNRLEIAKECASEFIRGRTRDRIGMVVFGAESFTVCPLTMDHDFLLDRILDLEIGTVPEDTTAIGMGLVNALNRLRESQNSVSAKNKVIILVTDGVNNAGQVTPITAAEIAKKMGVRIYTIGVGREGIVRVPVQTQLGQVYTRMKTEIDEVTLRDVAERTGGLYFRAQTANAFKKIYEKIDQLEKTKLNVKVFMNYRDLFPWLAGAAFILFGIERVFFYSFCRVLP